MVDARWSANQENAHRMQESYPLTSGLLGSLLFGLQVQTREMTTQQAFFCLQAD